MSGVESDGSFESLRPIVSASWLLGHLDEVVVCDVRTTMAGSDPRAGYLEAHIVGARFVSLDESLAAPPRGTDGRHPLPTPARFADSLSALGIGNDDVVVAYDDRGGAFAARLVWMLRSIGQEAALLDGGLSAWTGPVQRGTVESEPVEGEAVEAGRVEDGPADVLPVDRRVVAWPVDRIVDADEVAAHIDAGGVVVDSREHARYVGEVEPIDRIAGHVPGAINLPFAENLVDGRFLPPDRLAARFEALRSDSAAIVYCGSGVTACQNALAVEAAGLPPPRLYVGSWSGWTADPDRPVATGPNP